MLLLLLLLLLLLIMLLLLPCEEGTAADAAVTDCAVTDAVADTVADTVADAVAAFPLMNSTISCSASRHGPACMLAGSSQSSAMSKPTLAAV